MEIKIDKKDQLYLFFSKLFKFSIVKGISLGIQIPRHQTIQQLITFDSSLSEYVR